MDLVKILKALGDDTRLRMLNLLREQHLCVGELENILEINQSNASRHLARLQAASLITYTKKAQWVYYSLNRQIFQQVPFLEAIVTEELSRLPNAERDLRRLNSYRQSGMTCENLRDCRVDKGTIFGMD